MQEDQQETSLAQSKELRHPNLGSTSSGTLTKLLLAQATTCYEKLQESCQMPEHPTVTPCAPNPAPVYARRRHASGGAAGPSSGSTPRTVLRLRYRI